MLSKLKAVRAHSVSRNAAALGVMQIANYAVPLLLLPFLTRQLGMEAFGLVAITLAAIQLAFVLTDYGFSLSATYSISTNRENTDFVNRKISAIFGAKALLVSLLAIALIIINLVVSSFEIYTGFFIAAFIAVFAQAFQPIWLFQGIERMKNITIYTVLTKVLYAVLVIQFISKPDDAIIVIYCWSAAQFFGLLASLYFTYSAGYKVTLPSLQSVKVEFIEGAQFFWSRLAVAVYTSASTLIVGTHSAVQAAHFSVCEQIYKAGQNITSPINTAMFPYMAKHKNWVLFYTILCACGFIISLGCILLGVVAGDMLSFLFGSDYEDAKPVLVIFLCTTVVNYLAVAFGYSAFSALGYIRVANISVMVGALFHVAVLSIQYMYFQIDAFSVALSILFTETIVMSIRVVVFCVLKRLA